MATHPYARCAGCGRERQTTGAGKIKTHKRWDERQQKMVPCEGSLHSPAVR